MYLKQFRADSIACITADALSGHWLQLWKVNGKVRLQPGQQGWFPKPPKPQPPNLLYII